MLIEFKRQFITITRKPETKAVEYRDDLSRSFDKKVSILVVGKDIDTNIVSQYITAKAETSYKTS